MVGYLTDHKLLTPTSENRENEKIDRATSKCAQVNAIMRELTCGYVDSLMQPNLFTLQQALVVVVPNCFMKVVVYGAYMNRRTSGGFALDVQSVFGGCM